ncbi:outer membrane lipoprotein carrier protein LolA [Ulvibacterium sp.]|uniref:LolA family protein n=1 Tax=Ulvibacterium sp. TaxID=2665914 RepID=UPI0026096D38|nr:outer membrane lipoprotein carrier protein LolA [Ulvibacterium sp.]
MRNLVYLLWILVYTANAQSEMSATDAQALEAKVKKASNTTETITSSFKQYKHMDFLSNDIESLGKLSFKAPNLVKWEYTEPFAYSVIFKDDVLYINNEGNKSDMDIGSNKLFKQLNQLITNSIKGDLFDRTQFHINYFKKGSVSEVHFAPKDEDFAAFIKAFHITFNENGEVTEVKMLEPTNDYTRIVFKDRKTNQSLPDAVFAH